ARSSSREPVGIDSTAWAVPSPMRMTDPLPNCFSIWLRAADSARFLFSSILAFLCNVWSGLVVILAGVDRTGCDHAPRVCQRGVGGEPGSPARRVGKHRARWKGSVPAVPRLRAHGALLHADRH